MGELIYGAGTVYQLDDRTLAHLKVATGLRLRRRESFYVTWGKSPDQGSGRVSIWVSPSIPMQFHFSGSRPPELNRQWLAALDASALSETGMRIMHEAEAARFLEEAREPTPRARPTMSTPRAPRPRSAGRPLSVKVPVGEPNAS